MFGAELTAAEKITVPVDFTPPTGAPKALHGIEERPLTAGTRLASRRNPAVKRG